MSKSLKSPDPIPDAPADPEDVIWSEPSSGRKELRALTSLAITWAILLALYVARDILIPIALAILLSFVLTPVVRVLRRVGLHRIPAVFLAIFFALAVILSVGGLIGMQASEIVSDIPTYASVVDQKVANLREVATANVTGAVHDLTRWLPRATTAVKPPRPNAPDAANRPVPVEIHQPDLTAIDLVARLLPPVVYPLATTGIVFVVAIFVMLRQNDVRDRLIRLFGLQDLHRTTRALDDAAHRLTRYLLAQLGVNALFGVVIGIGLAVIGVPNPLLWGTLSALFRFLPYIGSILCAVLPVAVAAAVDPGWQMAIYTAVLFIVTEILMGQVVDPLAFGRSTGLSPLSVVLAAIFWTWMWGPIGLLLSVPLTVCLVVLGRHVKQLEFLDILMGDRPVLTPAERFCQRILANDPEEALEYAEELLKDQALIDYYDDVVIKGLHLAANDVERSAFGAALMVRTHRAMAKLIGQLDASHGLPPRDKNDGDTPAVDVEPGVAICVTAGDPLDRVVADMIARLLARRGIKVQIPQFTTSTYDSLDLLDMADASFFCVCGLDLSLRPAQSRYLVRRIRRLAPGVPILAGLMSGPLSDSDKEQLRREIGADQVLSSLRELDAFRFRWSGPRALDQWQPAVVPIVP